MSGCGGTVRYERDQIECPVCHIADSWVVTSVASSAWWAGITTCTNCGDQWGDGQLLARPFLRGWRQANIRSAIEAWETPCWCPVEWDQNLGFALIPCEHERQAS